MPGTKYLLLVVISQRSQNQPSREPAKPQLSRPYHRPPPSPLRLSGCYGATGAELRRDGNDLRVTFETNQPTDPNEQITCFRSFEPYAQFAVDSRTIEGVTTIMGKPPLS